MNDFIFKHLSCKNPFGVEAWTMHSLLNLVLKFNFYSEEWGNMDQALDHFSETLIPCHELMIPKV